MGPAESHVQQWGEPSKGWGLWEGIPTAPHSPEKIPGAQGHSLGLHYKHSQGSPAPAQGPAAIR